MLGKDLKIFDSGGTALIAGIKSCSIRKDCELIETSSPTSGTDETFVSGRTSWQISLSYLVAAPGTDLSKVGGSAVTVQVVVGTSTVLTGSAIFKTCEVVGAVGALAKGSFVLQGTGPLSPASSS